MFTAIYGGFCRRFVNAVVLVGLLTAMPTAFSMDAQLKRLMAIQPDAVQGYEIYRLCADCHGPEGQGKWDGSVPVISGQHQLVLIKQLRDFRDGRRKNEAMFPFSQDEAIGGDQAIADVTAYISTLLMPAEPAAGPGTGADEGEELYRLYCNSCHGANGEGNPELGMPRIHGQHYPYLVRQLEHIVNGERADSDPVMKNLLMQMDPVDREKIADYLSTQLGASELVAPEGWQNPDFNFGFQ